MGIRGAVSAIAASSLVAAVGFIVAPAPALAYETCNEIEATAKVLPAAQQGGDVVTLTVKLTNCEKETENEEKGDENKEGEAEREREREGGERDGSPATNMVVNFSQASGPQNCHVTFAAPSGTTNSQGIVTVAVTLPLQCPGRYELLATGTGFSAEADVMENGGFFPGEGGGPNASLSSQNQSFISADPSRRQPVPVLPLLLVGVGLVLVVGASAGLIRRPRSRSS
jgi:hypothetical protein